MRRREFLRAGGVAAGAAAGGAAVTGTAAAQEPDFGGWLDGVDGGFEDARGEDEVTVEVGAQGNGGAYAFSPAGLWVDPGTTVIWVWTGEGGSHNVHAVEGADFQSETTDEEGFEFEHTFEEEGIVQYQCDPHEGLDMYGAVAVGEDVPTTGGGGDGGGGGHGGGEVDLHELGVPIQAHFVGIGAILGLITSIIFTFYVLKYGTSPNTGYPREEE